MKQEEGRRGRIIIIIIYILYRCAWDRIPCMESARRKMNRAEPKKSKEKSHPSLLFAESWHD